MREYTALHLADLGDGVLRIGIPGREEGQTANRALHGELGAVFADLAADPEVRVGLLTGEGQDFLPSVDTATQGADRGSFQIATGLVAEALAIVENIVRCDKPVVTAIRGRAEGAGLAAALVSDISVTAKNAVLTDNHVRFGLPAGDHAALIWPLLCGPAKAKYHLLTSTPISGEEAAHIGLVSLAVDDAQVLTTATDIARNLARGPQQALRWTKHTLNLWLRQAMPVFEASLAYEALASFGDEHAAALTSSRPEDASPTTDVSS